MKMRVWFAPETEPIIVRWRKVPWAFGHTSFTLGRTVFTTSTNVSEPHVRHELTHVRQYQEFGFFKFLWSYLTNEAFRDIMEEDADWCETQNYPRFEVING